MKTGSILLMLLCTQFTMCLSMFTCKDGTKIDKDQFCDGILDCRFDKSDEIYTDVDCKGCPDYERSCTRSDVRSNVNRTCLVDLKYICDESISCLNIDPCDAGCEKTHYRCSDGSCVSRSTLCDEDSCSGCKEDTEWSTGAGFRCRRNERVCMIPQQLLLDEIQDCDNKEDLCFYDNDGHRSKSINKQRCFQCLDGSMIINSDDVCNGIFNCPDLSDECLCESSRPSICDVIEKNAMRNTSVCGVGDFPCDGRCRSRSKVCNGEVDCRSGIDERFDYCRGVVSCEKAPHTFANQTCRCTTPSKLLCRSEEGRFCDGIPDCSPPEGVERNKENPGSPDDECSDVCVHSGKSKYKCGLSFWKSPKLELDWINCSYVVEMYGPHGLDNYTFPQMISNIDWCNGVADCHVTKEDESRERCPHRFQCNSKHLVSIPNKKVCDGILDCDDGSDESNVTCPGRFHCSSLGNTRVSIERKHVCDLVINCDDGSDEMNCPTTDRFYCESGKPLFIVKRKMFDGVEDCEDWSDECPMKSKMQEDTIFSSRYELIANPFLKALIWLMGILSIFGNLFVMFVESKTLRRFVIKSDASSSLQANHLLVLNLSLADFLMGVYLLILGSSDAAYSGTYCKYKLRWLSSKTCVAMGILVVLSSQTSVAAMVLLTAFRLYAIYNPFSSSTRPKFRIVLLLLALIWIFSLTLALIPISRGFGETFTQQVLIEGNPFFSNTVVDFKTAKDLAGRLIIFGSHQDNFTGAMSRLDGTTKWEELQMLVGANYSDLLKVQRRFTYYSAHSVCIPKIFVHGGDPAWRFSFTITLWNFSSFLFVAVSYLAVYVKSKKSAAVRGENSKNQKKSRALQRKILRLVITDFCCWVPVSIMAFINLGGYPIPKIGYAVAAIVLLPINSSLNPILYSNLLDNYVKKIWKRKTSVNHTNVTAITVTYKANTSNRL